MGGSEFSTLRQCNDNTFQELLHWSVSCYGPVADIAVGTCALIRNICTYLTCSSTVLTLLYSGSLWYKVRKPGNKAGLLQGLCIIILMLSVV